MHDGLAILRGAILTHPAPVPLQLWKAERLLAFHGMLVTWWEHCEGKRQTYLSERARAEAAKQDASRRSIAGPTSVTDYLFHTEKKKASADWTAALKQKNALRDELEWSVAAAEKYRHLLSSSSNGLEQHARDIGTPVAPEHGLLFPPGTFIPSVKPDRRGQFNDPIMPPVVPYNVIWRDEAYAASATMTSLASGKGQPSTPAAIERADALYSSSGQDYVNRLSYHVRLTTQAMADWNRRVQEGTEIKRQIDELERKLAALRSRGSTP